jgi:hypothetical protein
MTDEGAKAKKTNEQPAKEDGGQETKPMRPEEEKESLKSADNGPHRAPSFLDKLKGHLKKGLTVLTSDMDE